MAKKACRLCKRIVNAGSICPSCKGSDLTTSHQGIVVIYDVESEIAKRLGIKEPGQYVLKI
ncbi:MAG: hypothetical protein HYW25_04255 [Candidatus Aenigmarchaeota archaeon]|nr:hypothetical protein [Candidatus Aenigmarchaeota archaeon]